MVTEKSFVHDRCKINLESMPDPCAIVNVDELKIRVQDVENIIHGNPQCDIVALAHLLNMPVTLLIEAKSGSSHSNIRTREAIDQLSWSMDHFDNIEIMCTALPIGCRRFPVLTHTKPLDAVLRSDSVKEKYRQFRRQHRTRIRFVRAGEDIWQAIQQNTT